MVAINVELNLPERLAEEARAHGLLEPASMERLLQQELTRQENTNAPFEAQAGTLSTDARRWLDMIHSTEEVDGPRMTDEEIQAEIDAVRAENRRNDERGH